MSDFENISEFELDGQEYHPSPQIVPDDHEGFSANGDYHTRNLNGANMDTPHTPNLPYRLAHQMQEAIIRQVEQNDYYVGQAERDDMATDIAYQWWENHEFEPPEIAFDALQYWRRIFRGVQGREKS